MTNISDFDTSFLIIDQVLFKKSKLISYEIKYIKDLNRSNSFYLVFNNLDAYFEKSGEFNFCFNRKNIMVLKDYAELWDEIKEHIELITGDKVTKYSKDFMK